MFSFGFSRSKNDTKERKIGLSGVKNGHTLHTHIRSIIYLFSIKARPASNFPCIYLLAAFWMVYNFIGKQSSNFNKMHKTTLIYIMISNQFYWLQSTSIENRMFIHFIGIDLCWAYLLITFQFHWFVFIFSFSAHWIFHYYHWNLFVLFALFHIVFAGNRQLLPFSCSFSHCPQCLRAQHMSAGRMGN